MVTASSGTTPRRRVTSPCRFMDHSMSATSSESTGEAKLGLEASPLFPFLYAKGQLSVAPPHEASRVPPRGRTEGGRFARWELNEAFSVPSHGSILHVRL